MSSSLLAAGVAVAAAGLLGSSSVAQRRGMLGPQRSQPDLRGGLLATLLRSGWWWCGTLASVAGLALQFVALTLGSLVLVQTTMVSSIVAAGLAEWALLRRSPGSSGCIGMALTVAGLVGVLWALAPTTGATVVPSITITLALDGVGLLGLALAGLWTRLRSGGSLALAAATGLGYGLTAINLKIVGAQLASGWAAPLTQPALWLAVVLGPISVLVSQHALHRARRVAAVVSLIVVLDPVVGLLAGATLFGEQMATTLLAVVTAGVAGAFVATGVTLSQPGPATPVTTAPAGSRDLELVGR